MKARRQSPVAAGSWGRLGTGVVLRGGFPCQSLQQEGQVYAHLLEPREGIPGIADGPVRFPELPYPSLRRAEVCGVPPVPIQVQTRQGRGQDSTWDAVCKQAPSVPKAMEHRISVLRQLCVLCQEAACPPCSSDTFVPSGHSPALCALVIFPYIPTDVL